MIGQSYLDKTVFTLRASPLIAPVYHPFLYESPSLISFLWGNKELDSPTKYQDDGNFLEQRLHGLQIVQFECPKYRKSCVLTSTARFLAKLHQIDLIIAGEWSVDRDRPVRVR